MEVKNVSITPTAFPPERCVQGACQRENHAVLSAHGDNCGYSHLQNLGLGSAGEGLALRRIQGEFCCPQLPGSLTGKAIFCCCCQTVGFGKGPGGGFHHQVMLNNLPGETQLVTGWGLLWSLCLTVFMFLGYLRKTSTAQSPWWPHPALCGCIPCIDPRSWPTKALPIGRSLNFSVEEEAWKKKTQTTLSPTFAKEKDHQNTVRHFIQNPMTEANGEKWKLILVSPGAHLCAISGAHWELYRLGHVCSYSTTFSGRLESSRWKRPKKKKNILGTNSTTGGTCS